MKNTKAYNYLNEYNNQCIIISHLADQICTMKSLIEHPQGSGINLSDKGRSTTTLSKDLIFNTCLDISLLEEKYKEEIERAKVIKRNIELTIHNSFNPKQTIIERLILEYLFIYSYKKSQILHELGLNAKQYEYYYKKGLEVIECTLNNIYSTPDAFIYS